MRMFNQIHYVALSMGSGAVPPWVYRSSYCDRRLFQLDFPHVHHLRRIFRPEDRLASSVDALLHQPWCPCPTGVV